MMWQNVWASSSTDPVDPRRARWGKIAVWFAAVLFTISIIINAIALKYRLGVDIQKHQCLPWVIYVIELGNPKGHIQRGEYLAFSTKNKMGHGFDGQVIVKLVGAVPGDRLTIKNDTAYVNGILIGGMDLVRRLGKSPNGFDRDVVVPQGNYLLLGTQPKSYDGRYWGFVEDAEIIGKVHPVI